MHIIAYDDSAVEVMESCIIHAYLGSTINRWDCQVTQTEGYHYWEETIVKMNWVVFTEIRPLQRRLNSITCIINKVCDPELHSSPRVTKVDKLKANQIKGTVEDEVIQPVMPTVMHNKENILNGKRLPTTKNCWTVQHVMKEYKAVFNGIGIFSRRTIPHSAERKLYSSPTCTLPSSSKS